MVQIEKTKAADRGQSTHQAGTVFRVTVYLLGITSIVTLVNIVLAIALNAWQMYALTAVVFAFGLVALLGLRLIRAGHSHRAVKLIIGGTLVTFLAAGLLVAGSGLVLSIGLILWVAAVATQTLPVKQSSWAIIASIVVGGIILLIDQFNPSYRLSFPLLQNFLLAIIVILLLIYVAFIARQFSSYTLRTKLIISFLALSVLAVGTIAFFATQTTTAALTENVGNNLKDLTEARALNIGDLMLRQVDAMRSLTLSRELRDRVILANKSYGTTNPEQIRAKMAELDQKWIAAAAEGDFDDGGSHVFPGGQLEKLLLVGSHVYHAGN